MRVISGSLKGRLIDFLKNDKTRPLKDNVKENIFNIIKHSRLINLNIENSKVLDLYSGIGSFGIECVSRGAKKVTFVERDINALKILKRNLTTLTILNKTKIYSNEIENILIKNKDEKFNIFFFDAPFKDLKFTNNIKLIKENKLFQKEHIVIIHRERKTVDNFENFLRIIETKNYGRSKIIFGLFT